MSCKRLQITYCSRIKKISRSSPTAATTPEFKDGEEKGLAFENCTTPGNLPGVFMLQCMNLYKMIQKHNSDHGEKGIHRFRRMFCGLLPRISKQNTVFALKCSMSLGLAVLLGLTYTKENGYWSGLTIAITFVTSRQATFTVTNARAQGTALGSVYGVLAYFVCHNCGLLKLLSLLPWIIFTTFLRHSKMYGEAGSISAIIAALLILGRKDYGTPSEFAIARLIEAFIGLSCFIVVEILIQPQRAAVLVKFKVSQSFRALKILLEETAIRISQPELDTSSFSIEGKRTEIDNIVHELERLVHEAKEEPNFWYTPFPGDCYTPLVESVRKVASTSFFMAYFVEELCLHLQRPEVEWKGYRDQICIDIKLFSREISNALGNMEEAISSNNSTTRDSSHDTEMGKPVPQFSRFRISEIDKEKTEIIIGSFLDRTRDVSERGEVMENLELKKLMLLSMGSIAFCMRSLVTETVEIGKLVNDMI